MWQVRNGRGSSIWIYSVYLCHQHVQDLCQIAGCFFIRCEWAVHTRIACTYISRCTHGPCMIHLNHHSYHISLYNLSFWRDRNQRLPLWSSVHFKSIIRFCHWYICWPAIDTDFAKFTARNFLTTWHMLIHHWYWPCQMYCEKLGEAKWHIEPFTAREQVILSMLNLV